MYEYIPCFATLREYKNSNKSRSEYTHTFTKLLSYKVKGKNQ